jgi:hypothetical protein
VAFINAGNYLLSHTVSRAVQSAQRGLTSVFGMGTGGTPAVKSPTSYRICRRAIPFLAGRESHRIAHAKSFERSSGLHTGEDHASQLNRLVLRKSTSQAIFQAQKHSLHVPSKFYGQAERAISTRKLHALLRFHIEPIKQVIFLCPSCPFWVGRSHLEACFPLICIQRLSQPNFATQPCHWHDSWNTRGSSIPVLSY